jgi:hypothetical protein
MAGATEYPDAVRDEGMNDENPNDGPCTLWIDGETDGNG